MPSSTTLFKKGNKAGANGRPVTPFDVARMAPIIEKLAARGCRQADIARAVEIGAAKFARLLHEDDAVRGAFDAGRQVMHDALVGKLFERAMQGDLVAILFSLKAFFNYRDQNDPNANVEFRPQISITLPGAMPLAQYAAMEGELTKALPKQIAKDLVRG